MRLPRPLLAGILVLGLLAMAIAACGREAVTPSPGDPTLSPTQAVNHTPTPSFDAAAYFTGRTITVVVGSSPGGGSDTGARLFTLFAGKHIPGAPRFLVQNVPGAGQLQGLQTTMLAEPDGLTMGLLHQRWAIRDSLGEEVPNFSLDRVRILGSPANVPIEEMICADSGIATTYEAARNSDTRLDVGASAPGARATVPIQLLDLTGGSPFNLIFGYGGNAEIMAAFDRGELDAMGPCTARTVDGFPDWIEQGRLAPFFWWDAPPDAAFLSQLGAAEPPHFFDVAGDQLNQEQRDLFEALQDVNKFARAFVMPPDVPEDVYNVLREAFEDTIRDHEYIARANSMGVEVGFGSADDMRRTFGVIQGLSPDSLELFQELLESD